MSRDGFDLAAEMRRSETERLGVRGMEATDLATLRAYLRKMGPQKRVREVYTDGCSLSDPAVDRIWNVLGRMPTAAEFRELAKILREAAANCEKRAKRKR